MDPSEQKQSSIRRVFIALSVLIAFILIVAATVGVLWFKDAINPYNDAAFDSQGWLIDEDIRMAMSEDLVDNHLPKGMSDSKVQLLLGQAERILTTPQDGGGNSLQGHHTWTYYIGNDSFGVGDDVFVYVHFDASGQVVGCGIYGY